MIHGPYRIYGNCYAMPLHAMADTMAVAMACHDVPWQNMARAVACHGNAMDGS